MGGLADLSCDMLTPRPEAVYSLNVFSYSFSIRRIPGVSVHRKGRRSRHNAELANWTSNLCNITSAGILLPKSRTARQIMSL